jgi:exonuclease SbcD
MKKPIAIIWNDVHLKTGNEDSVLIAFNYMLDKANELGIKKTIFAGDLFDSRTMQRLKVLKTFDTMLKSLSSAGMTVDIIPGNHDKTIYASYDSFLEQFRYHPSVKYYSHLAEVDYEGIKFTYLPFFSDDMLIPMLEKSKGADVLISHFEMQGSTHLGQTSEKSTINKKLLSKWKKTYLGHYHNHHEITKDIVHLPSFVQANFGEDENKGFTVLYDDLSYEIIKGRFKSFRKLVINLDEQGNVYVKEMIKQYSNKEDTIRFEFIGKESKLKALDKSMFRDTGIDVKLKYKQKFEFNDNDSDIPDIIEKFDKEQINKTFEEFCKDKGLNFKEGLKILSEFLKNK